jgi:hypothetical protein
MFKRKLVCGWLLAACGSLAFATTDLDLSDFDDDMMRDMDDAVKALDSHIAMKDAQASTADAQFIVEGLQWAEGYFTGKNHAPDAVRWSSQGREHASAIVSAATKSDFDAAFASYRSLVKTCRSCHDVYKSPEL